MPLTILPGWVRPLSWALRSDMGRRRDPRRRDRAGAWPEIALALTLGAIYLAIGIAILETVLSSARRAGTLALA